MITVEPAPRHGGFVLFFDDAAFEALRDACLDLTEHGKRVHTDGYLFTLASDITNARHDEDITGVVTAHDGYEVSVYGTECNWVMMFAQMALLRTAQHSTGKRRASKHEGIIEELESAVFVALEDAHGVGSAEDTIGWYHRILRRNLHESDLGPLIGSRVSFFLQLSPADRKAKLLSVLRSFIMLSIAPGIGLGYSSYDFDKHGWKEMEGLPRRILAL